MNWGVFLVKEIKDIIRTKKLLILASIFLFIAFTSPLSARYVKEMLKYMGDGITIIMPDPVYTDAYAQFYKNLSQIGVIVMILVFMGMVVEEKTKGTASLVLTKNLTRSWFILCKLIAAVALFTVSYIVSMSVCMYYTYVLFNKFINPGIWWAILLFWVYGVFLIALTLLASTISKSHTFSAVLSFIAFALTAASGSIPYIKKVSPGILNSVGLEILMGSKTWKSAVLPLGATVILTAAVVASYIYIFNRQEL